MKNFKTLVMALITGILCLNFAACDKDEEIIPSQEKYITVNLGVTGEYVELKESPLATRASQSDVYSIKVYTRPGGMGDPVPYAYGVFTSLEDVSIKLLEGQTYRFVASIVVNATIMEDYFGDTISIQDDYVLEMGQYLSADFTYTTSWFSSDDYVHDYHYEKERFYGQLDGYIPTQNGVVEIATKRTVYGAHFIAERLTEGRLEVNVNSLYTVNLTPAVPDYNGVYSFSNQRDAWFGTYKTVDELVDYYTAKDLSIYWRKDDGSVTPLGTYRVTFKRNVKTSIRIKVEEPGYQNGIVITREEEPMVDDENEYVIEGGKVTEVPIRQN